VNNGATQKSVCFILLAILVCGSRIVVAGPELPAADGKDYSKEVVPVEKSWCETPKSFEIRIGAPGWLAGISGESGVLGLVDSADVSFSQLFRNLTHVPIVLSAELRYGRWEIFGDGQYMEVGASATLTGILFTNANLHLKDGLAEGFLGYRLINCDKAFVSLFAGARYNYEGVNLSIFDNGNAQIPILRELLGLPKKLDAEGSIDWVDPVIGMRGRLRIWKAQRFLRKAMSVGLTPTLTPRLNCTARDGPSRESRWIALTGATSWRAGSNFNLPVTFGRRSDGVT